MSTDLTHLVNFSFGIGSWATAKLVVQKYGVENTLLLFCDTLSEDEDTYAWGRAAAQNVGAELVWLKDGRDIWQVFRDARFIGNSRVDPCSKILKRELADRWVESNFTPATCIRYFGIHWSESERIKKIQERLPEWVCRAPLCEPPLLAYERLHQWAEEEGLWKQKLYQEGFTHANCSGACVKAGQASWAHLLQLRPEVYRRSEEKEEELRNFLQKDVSILRDRRGGDSRPMTLKEFRERIESKGCQGYDTTDWGGCACFSGGED